MNLSAMFGVCGADGAMLVKSSTPKGPTEKEALRDFVLAIAEENGVDTSDLGNVIAFLTEKIGDDFAATARRITQARTKGTNETRGKLFTALGKRFEFKPSPTLAVEQALKLKPADDPKAKRAADMNRLAPIAKRATKSDLAKLADEAASDPADVKLVAMMLLMFRDA